MHSYLAQNRLEDGIVILRRVDTLKLRFSICTRLLQRLTEQLIRRARVHRMHGLDLARALDVMQQLCSHVFIHNTFTSLSPSAFINNNNK